MDNNKRPEDMVRITTDALAQAFIDEQVEAIQKQVVTRRCCWRCREAWIPPLWPRF